MKSVLRYLAIFSISLLWMSHGQLLMAAERPKLRLACLASPEAPGYSHFLTIYQKAFATLGYDVELVTASTADTIRRLQQGEVDGDCARTKNFKQLPGVPPLVRTDSVLRQIYIGAWGTRNQLTTDILEEESRHRLRFGFDSGIALMPGLVQKMGFKNITRFNSLEEGFQELRAGNIDIWLGLESRLAGGERALLGKDIELLSPVAVLPLYGFLLPKHKTLIAPLSREIQQLVNPTTDLHASSTLRDASDSEVNNTGTPSVIFGCALSDQAPLFKAFERNYRQAFKILGYEFSLISLPPARAEAELIAGRIDGSCGRSDRFFKNRSEVVKVPQKIVTMSYLAWSHSPNLRLNSLPSLRAAQLRVGHVRGVHLLPDNMQEENFSQVIAVTTPTIGMKMLAAGRLDIFIMNSFSMKRLVQRLDSQKPLYMVSDIHLFDAYPALRPGLEALAKPLAQQLTQIKEF